MSHKLKKKIVFVSVYYETLKAVLPLIESLESEYDIYVLAKYYPFGKDRELSENAIRHLAGEMAESLDLGDQASWRLGKGLSSRWYRLGDSLLKTVRSHWKADKQARNFILRLDPDLVILCSDSRILERYLVEHCQRKKIPTICLQWALSAISEQSIKEGKKRTLTAESRTVGEKIADRLYDYCNYVVGKLNGLVVLLLGLKVKLRINPTKGVRVFGQGNATKLALIGTSSREFHLEMGTPDEKLEVIGHPLYESLYNRIVFQAKSKPCKEDIYKSLGIPLDCEFVLWANNDSKKQYSKYYTDEYMFDSWKEKLTAILDANDKVHVVFKIHPVWNHLPDFIELEKLSPRVKVLAGMDIEDILPFASALIIRHSMAGIYGMLYHVPIVSFNYPSLPVGGLFEDIGGTIHVGNSSELQSVMSRILNKDDETLALLEHKKKDFLYRHLAIDCTAQVPGEIRSIMRMKELIARLLGLTF